MKFCENCQEYKADTLELCDDCWGPLSAAPPSSPPVVAEVPPSDGPDEEAAAEESAADAWLPLPETEPDVSSREPQAAEEGEPRFEERPDVDELSPEEPPLLPEATYDEILTVVQRYEHDGFDLFAFVGNVGSGKTHGLKALNYRLDSQGVTGDKSRNELSEHPVPPPSAHVVFDYPYRGPNDERWVFIDAGGELYRGMQRNEWEAADDEAAVLKLAERLKLTNFLQRCKGLFMFLHLRPGHLRFAPIDRDPRIHGDDGERRKAQDARREIDFFRDFLLLLRAIRLEGDVREVIKQCRSATSLEDALLTYHSRAPLLDIPVMFFFSMADIYLDESFDIVKGVPIAPIALSMSTAAFVARFLPSLFASLISQVRRFKFDFLQSYIETRVTDLGEKVTKETHWHAPDDEEPLSVGLLSGVEFALRNQTADRSWWRTPGIDTRQALLLHRLLHPDQWRDVKVNLGGFWRPPREVR